MASLSCSTSLVDVPKSPLVSRMTTAQDHYTYVSFVASDPTEQTSSPGARTKFTF
jgi:hypothetical protein